MSQADQLEKFKRTFFQECDELIGELEDHVNALRGEADVEDALNGMFRVLHTIKGGAGMFGFRRITAFAHGFETALDQVRNAGAALTGDTLASFLLAGDVLSDLIQDARVRGDLPADHEAVATDQLARIAGPAAPRPDTEAAMSAGAKVPPACNRLRIAFRPKPELFQTGNEPLLIIRQLQELGRLAVEPDLTALPPLDALDPATAYLGWTFELETAAGLDEVRQAFEFVEADCDLDIVTLESSPAPQPAEPAAAPREGLAVRHQRRMATIRVELDRIDRLVNMVGEIAIVQTMVAEHAGKLPATTHSGLLQELGRLHQLTQTLQDSVMAIRAVPVGTVFGRMPRLLRELAAATGKEITIETAGDDTEIDKTVVEQLGDPLMHMIRNAVDHGIEPPEEREAAGKPREGQTALSAMQRGSQIVIEMSDDGRGIDPGRIRQRAVDRGLIAPDASLSPDEITQLIFLPGFSTADQVTGISGRGVGMDVVKRNIQKLGGRITLHSEVGRGTTFTITLPLTLAILPGMIVRSGPNAYVIPLLNIVECLQARPGQIRDLPELGEVLRFRDRHLPLIRLNRVFGMNRESKAQAPLVVVVDDENNNTLALAVDEIAGQQQVVIKSLRENLDPVPGLAGATILGDGKVALILVLADLLELHRSRSLMHRLDQNPTAPSRRIA